jgi:phosphoglycolate phosphatase-like HAD superfamily hydrolase
VYHIPVDERMNSDIELLRSFRRGDLRVALLDFDGTLSLIRQGWQEVMISYMVGVLEELNSGESRGELYALVEEFVNRLTGKQTIYQMICLAEEVKRRGGTPGDPLYYKRRYYDLLQQKIDGRLADLRNGRAKPEEWMVPGALALLRNLRRRGISMYLASGTDKAYVVEESELLGIRRFFCGRIYGALDDYRKFSKKMLIQEILCREQVSGPDLVSFGDGYVEIKDTKEVGGLAIGVACEETLRRGVDQWKRRRLIDSGADIIVGDLRCQETLLAYLFGDTESLL